MSDRSVVLLCCFHTNDLMHNTANNDAILSLRRSCQLLGCDDKALVTGLDEIVHFALPYALQDAFNRGVASRLSNCPV